MNTQSPLSSNKTDFKILSLKFNQDQGCFAIGHENGFLVFNSNPIDLRVKRMFNGSSSSNSGGSNSGTGIGLVTMLHRTNYLALVGGGKNPKFPNNKLVIWDDLKRKNSLSLEFMSSIVNVLLSRIRIVVVLKNQVLVYGFSSPPKKFTTYETIDNEYGLADLSVTSSSLSSSSSSLSSLSSSINEANSFIPSTNGTPSNVNDNKTPASSSKDKVRYQTLAFPGRSVGQLQIVDVSPSGQEKNLISIIKAHKSKIRCFCLNRSGSMVASASETGTLIRIHSTHSTALLYEFRRGLDRAIIASMKFSPDDSRLAVLSDKNTLHIYNLVLVPDSSDTLSEHSGDGTITNDFTQVNRRHLLNKIPFIPFNNYFNSTWSFCSINTNQYHEADTEAPEDTGVIGWTGNDVVILVWKVKKIWEKYLIVEESKSDDRNKTSTKWIIVRSSWKSLELPRN